MALLVEGLGVGGETSIEEYIIGSADKHVDGQEPSEKDKIRLYGPEEGLSWVAKPVTGQSSLALISRQGSLANQSMPLMDPLVTLFGSVHEKLPETASTRSMLFPNFGSMYSAADPRVKNEQWDEESLHSDQEDSASEAARGDSDDNVHSPLISRQTTSLEKDLVPPASHGSSLSMRRHSTLIQPHSTGGGETVGATGIGGGWQLAWKWSEKEGEDGNKEGGFKRIYLHQEEAPAGSRRGSLVSLAGEGDFIQASALVSQPALYPKQLGDQHPFVGPAMLHPSETASKGPIPIWATLLQPGVKHALFVGVGIQILQQVCSTKIVSYTIYIYIYICILFY